MLLVGLIPVIAVVATLWWFGRQTFLYEPKGDPHEWATANGSFGDHAFWHTSGVARELRKVHFAAACTMVGITFAGFLSGGPDHPLGVHWGWFVLPGLALLLSWFAFAFSGWHPVLSKERESTRRTWDGRIATTLKCLVFLSVVYAIVAVGAAVIFMWGRKIVGAPLAGFEITINAEVFAAGVLLVALLVAVLLLRCSATQPGWTDVPAPFAPLWGGCAAWVIASFGTLLAVGLSGGLAFRVADFVGKPVPKLTGP